MDAAPPDGTLDRRRFALGGLLGGLTALGTASGGAWRAAVRNPYRPVLERVAIPLPAAHRGLAGLRIAFVADTHVGPSIRPADVARAAALLLDATFDLALFGGDYLSDSPRHAADAAAALVDLAQAAPLGAFAVVGNHDGGEIGRMTKMVDALENVGIPVLRNRSVPVGTPGGTLWIAGVDDVLLGNPDPAATLAGVPSGSAVLGLWHEPDWAERLAERGVFAQLSGHSHGGQVRLPGIGPVILPRGGRRYPQGLNVAAGMPVYTSRGVGVYRPPIRFNCPPEVTLITLVAA